MMAYVRVNVSDYSYHTGPFLSDLLPSVGARLGVEPFSADAIGLPDSSRYVVVLVDGLGWEITMRGCLDAPYIASVIGDAPKIRASIPTTTSASLTSLWTGLPAGSHGVVGFSFHLDGEIVVPLFEKKPVSASRPVADQMVDAGVAVTWVIPAEHVGSGMTRMGTTRARVVGVDIDDHGARVQKITTAARRGKKSLVYAYDQRLDEAGHRFGVNSIQWRRALARIDAFLEELRESLDEDVRLLVTGDHGMVDVAQEDRLEIESEPVLHHGLRLIGGEARFRHLYTNAAQAVADRWRDRVGDKAAVMTRDEAIDAGFFGLVQEQHRPRIGDVVVVSLGPQAYLTSRFPGEYYLVGMHGGCTSAELFVPVLID